MKKVTLTDLAKELGVSASSVSRALHSPQLVSPQLKEAARQAAQAQGYAIKSNKRHKSRAVLNIQLMLPCGSAGKESLYHFNDAAALALGIKQGLSPAKANIILNIFSPSLKLFEYKKLGSSDAFVFAFCVPKEEQARQIAALKLPFLLLNRTSPRYNYIACNHNQAFAALYRRAKSKAHARNPNQPFKAAYLGVKANAEMNRLRQAAVSPFINKSHMFEAPLSPALIQKLLQENFNLLMCFNDAAAVQALALCERLGVNVPGQLAITGFDCSALQILAAKPIASAQLSASALGLKTGKFLNDCIFEKTSYTIKELAPCAIAEGQTI